MDLSSSREVSSSRGSVHFVDFEIFFETFVGSSTFVELIEFFGSVYFVDYLEFLPSKGSIHFVD